MDPNSPAQPRQSLLFLLPAMTYVVLCALALFGVSVFLVWEMWCKRLAFVAPYALPVCVGLFLFGSLWLSDPTNPCPNKMFSLLLSIVLAASFPAILNRPTRPPRPRIFALLLVARCLWALNMVNWVLLFLPDKVNVVSEKRGNVMILCESAEDKNIKLISVGPHWPYAVITLLALIGIPAAFVAYFSKKRVNRECITVSIALSVVTLLSFCVLFFRDAGIVVGYMVRRGVAQTNMWSYCDRCNTFRPQGTIHCSVCNCCVEDCDHHCPFTGKCVGKNNLRYFHVFLTLLVVTLLYHVILSILVLTRAAVRRRRPHP